MYKALKDYLDSGQTNYQHCQSTITAKATVKRRKHAVSMWPVTGEGFQNPK